MYRIIRNLCTLLFNLNGSNISGQSGTSYLTAAYIRVPYIYSKQVYRKKKSKKKTETIRSGFDWLIGGDGHDILTFGRKYKAHLDIIPIRVRSLYFDPNRYIYFDKISSFRQAGNNSYVRISSTAGCMCFGRVHCAYSYIWRSTKWWMHSRVHPTSSPCSWWSSALTRRARWSPRRPSYAEYTKIDAAALQCRQTKKDRTTRSTSFRYTAVRRESMQAVFDSRLSARLPTICEYTRRRRQ